MEKGEIVKEGRETEQEGRYTMKEEKEGNMRTRDGRHKQVCQKRGIEKGNRWMGREEIHRDGGGRDTGDWWKRNDRNIGWGKRDSEIMEKERWGALSEVERGKELRRKRDEGLV